MSDSIYTDPIADKFELELGLAVVSDPVMISYDGEKAELKYGTEDGKATILSIECQNLEMLKTRIQFLRFILDSVSARLVGFK